VAPLRPPPERLPQDDPSLPRRRGRRLRAGDRARRARREVPARRPDARRQLARGPRPVRDPARQGTTPPGLDRPRLKARPLLDRRPDAMQPADRLDRARRARRARGAMGIERRGPRPRLPIRHGRLPRPLVRLLCAVRAAARRRRDDREPLRRRLLHRRLGAPPRVPARTAAPRRTRRVPPQPRPHRSRRERHASRLLHARGKCWRRR
jgi:hypothetical protein